MSAELLLELLSEEIPARMQRRAIDDLTDLVRDKLAAAEIPAKSVTGYVTPRRLAVIADGIPATQPDRAEERRGPRVGAPQQALDGFLRGAGLASIDSCEIRDTGRGEFYFAVLAQKGRPSVEVLPELLLAAIAELPWPKSMRFPAASLRWVRPLSSVICLFDGEILPLALGQVPVGRLTRGHRFLSRGEITVANAADYLDRLESACVVLVPARRREMIAEGLDRLAAAEGLTVKPDPGLLDEVTGLVEYPVVLAGTIDRVFMDLPPEVLTTAMRTHQKYFSCLNPDGTPAPRFLFVANNRTADDGKTISAGNERVLRARLSDARFFWDQDRKTRLEARVDALKDRVFHAKLGSVYDKVERVEKLAVFLAGELACTAAPQPVTPAKAGVQGGPMDSSPDLIRGSRGNDDRELGNLAKRAARLCKADLSTGMVGEFPELQGIMGRYYALDDGEDPQVADAIADHYKPLGPADNCPTASVSVVVALADKIDTLVAFFANDERPTGSRDPFALRRAALGIIRLILENNLRLGVGRTFFRAYEHFELTHVGMHNPIVELVEFIVDRLKVHLREQGVRHDLITASFALREEDLVRLLARVAALHEFLNTADGGQLVIAYRRASNIVVIEEKRDGCSYDGSAINTLFCQPEEQALALGLDAVGRSAGGALARERFDEAMASLATLRRPVDEFFDKVTVNAKEPELRENRLRLLSRIRAVMNQVADFSKIEG